MIKKILSILVFLFILSSCTSTTYLRKGATILNENQQVQVIENTGFWDQKVLVTAWGFTMMTPYGPFNIGYVQWQRNIDKNPEPAKPSDVPGFKLNN